MAAVDPIRDGVEPAARETPAWFSAGVEINDVYARSPDAEFIYDRDFADDEGIAGEDLHWRECLVPVDAIHANPRGGQLHAFISGHIQADRRGEKLHVCVDLDDLADEGPRLEDIRQWIRDRGGIEAALVESPILVTIKDGVVKVDDGWHRLGLAKFEHGMTSVRALCAMLPALPRPTSRRAGP